MKVADMHCDTIYELKDRRIKGESYSLRSNDLNISLEKMQQGDYFLQNFAVFTEANINKDVVKHAQDMIDTFYLEMDKNKDLIEVVTSYDDIERCLNNNKMAAMLTLEDGAVVNNDLSYLRNYYRLGVRMITLTWNFENGIGYPNFDMESATRGYGEHCDKGLTEFGIAYIQEMERLGIIIDTSHLSDGGFYDVLRYTNAPFVASHSNVRALCPHARNLTDDMIKALAKRGGVMGINYAAEFLNDRGDDSLVEDMVKHIEYIRDLVGIDYVGLGSDFDGIDQNLEMKDCSYLPLLEQALYDHGFTKEEVEKVFYKNVLRVYQAVLK